MLFLYFYFFASAIWFSILCFNRRTKAMLAKSFGLVNIPARLARCSTLQVVFFWLMIVMFLWPLYIGGWLIDLLGRSRPVVALAPTVPVKAISRSDDYFGDDDPLVFALRQSEVENFRGLCKRVEFNSMMISGECCYCGQDSVAGHVEGCPVVQSRYLSKVLSHAPGGEFAPDVESNSDNEQTI
jgi:hypothetical protein